MVMQRAVLGPQEYGRRTIPDLLERSRAFGKGRAIAFDVATGREVAFGEFLDRVAGVATKLTERFKQGDAIAVLVGNGIEYFVLRYALACAGLVEVALNTAHRGPILKHMLDLAAPRAVIVDDRYLENLESANQRGQGLERIGESELRELTSQPGRWGSRPLLEIAPSDPARIVFTSGTSGRSKGVELSHAYEVYTGERHTGLIGIGPEDRWLYVTPMFHIDAIYIASILFHTGGALAIAPDFSVSRFWADVETSRATYLCHLGAIFGLLLKGDDPPPGCTLKTAVGGGASAAQIEQVERRFGIHVLEAFAMTECIACTINRIGHRKLGTAGQAIDGYEVAIADPHGDPLPSGEAGEIIVRAAEPSGIFTSYVGDPSETSRVMRNGWFHTGDLGILDDDGFLTYRGRLKDAIRVKGENVSAMELEAIADLHPAVVRSAAVGVSSEIGDEEILLYVETRDPAFGGEALRDYIAKRAAAFVVPKYIRAVEFLPLTATGKVDKSALSRQLSEIELG